MVVRRLCRAGVLLLALLVPTGCEYFTTSPFPGFVDKTDAAVDLGSRISAIKGAATTVTYDLQVVTDPAAVLPPRVLLLVEPPSGDASGGFDYKGKLIVLDQDLNVLGQAGTASSMDYFSKPYAYGADNRILAGGCTVLDGNGAFSLALTPLGLEGFAFKVGTFTYIFSTPGGQYASFDLSYQAYAADWSISYTGIQTLSIIPQAARPSPSDPAYASLGYQLRGLTYDSASGYVTFVFSEPSTAAIHVARMLFGDAITPGAVILPGPTSWPVGDGAWPLSTEQDRPALSADAGGLFMVQRDGWITRRAWTPAAQSLAWAGSPVQITGDRSLGHKYAFLVPATGTPYMYRFEPSSGMLTRCRQWW